MKFDLFSVKLLAAGAIGLGSTFLLLGQYQRAVQTRLDNTAFQLVVYRDLTLAALRAGQDARYSPEARQVRAYALGTLAPKPEPWTAADAEFIAGHLAAPIGPRCFQADATFTDIEPYQIVLSMLASIEARVQGRTGPIDEPIRQRLTAELVRLEASPYQAVQTAAAGTLKVLASFP